ncbi:hypothetical protein, partial [Streptomyces sp. ADI97-07]|uniref:hypothetical protein n=1 Tax=Streptomyces sp. ADI97-07 TaxID=1522762 RepID=UPI0019CF4F2D
MFGKRTAVVSLSAVALVVIGAAAAQADDGPKFENNGQILSCFSLEALNLPVASTSSSKMDCSTNYEWNTQANTNTTVIDANAAPAAAPAEAPVQAPAAAPVQAPAQAPAEAPAAAPVQA